MKTNGGKDTKRANRSINWALLRGPSPTGNSHPCKRIRIRLTRYGFHKVLLAHLEVVLATHFENTLMYFGGFNLVRLILQEFDCRNCLLFTVEFETLFRQNSLQFDHKNEFLSQIKTFKRFLSSIRLLNTSKVRMNFGLYSGIEIIVKYNTLFKDKYRPRPALSSVVQTLFWVTIREDLWCSTLRQVTVNLTTVIKYLSLVIGYCLCGVSDVVPFTEVRIGARCLVIDEGSLWRTNKTCDLRTYWCNVSTNSTSCDLRWLQQDSWFLILRSIACFVASCLFWMFSFLLSVLDL